MLSFYSWESEIKEHDKHAIGSFNSRREHDKHYWKSQQGRESRVRSDVSSNSETGSYAFFTCEEMLPVSVQGNENLKQCEHVYA